MNIDAETHAQQLQVLLPRLWCLIAAILVGTALGETLYFGATGRWLRGFSMPWWYTLFVAVCMAAVAARVRSTAIRCAIVLQMLFFISSYWKPAADWSTVVWAAQQTTQAVSGSLFAFAGRSVSRRFRIFALLITVAFVEFRYVTLDYLAKLRPYPSVIKSRLPTNAVADSTAV